MSEQNKISTGLRDFLRWCGLETLAPAVGGALKDGKLTAFDQLPKEAKSKEGWYPGQCKMCMQGDCLQRVHVVDGIVVEVQGDKRSPSNKGTLCARGNSAIMNLYNPWRVKAPMKRTNPKKGLKEDPRWVEISWEEALSTVAEKLKAIREKDPRRLVIVSGFGNFAANEFSNKALAHAFGTPNLLHTHGEACAYHFGPIYTQGAFPESVQDLLKTEYMLVFGKGLGANRALSSTSARTFVDAIDRGAKIVIVDPRCSIEASKSTQWISIRPGTDCAFLLAMLHTVLYEVKNFDVWFVKNRTNGPYLIGPDGYYVRDKESKKPLIWDQVLDKARPFDEISPMDASLEGSYSVHGLKAVPAFQLIKESVAKYTPEWAVGITSVPAKTIRQVAHEFIAHAHIGETITIGGVPMPFRPVGIQYQRGAYGHSLNGPRGDIVARILCELAGAFDVPGGVSTEMFPYPGVLQPDEDGLIALRDEMIPTTWEWPPKTLQQRMFYPISHQLAHIGARAMNDPKEYHLDYEVEMILNYGGNPFHSLLNKDIWEKAYAKTTFNAAICQTYDEVTMMSDILLPEHSFMERDFYEWSVHESMGPQGVMHDDTRLTQIFGRRDASAIRNPYKTREGDEIIYELADRVGILKGHGGVLEWLSDETKGPFKLELDINRRYSKRELSEIRLQKVFHFPKSLDDINDESGPLFNVLGGGSANYNYFFWPENKTRHPMYMILLKQVSDSLRKNIQEAGIDYVPGWKGKMDYWWKAWDPLPSWVPSRELIAPEEYDLNAFNFKTVAAPFKIGDVIGNPYLYETFKTYDPYEYAVLINTRTAAKKGLKDGDQVIVQSRYGATQGRLKTTELINHLAVGIPGTHGQKAPQENPIIAAGPCFNVLCSARQEDSCVDPITGGIEWGPAVRVFKASKKGV